MLFRTLSLAFGLGLLSAACSSTSASVGTSSDMSSYDMAIQSGEAYTLSVLRVGDPAAAPKGKALAELTERHQAFLEELFEESFLMTSGPLVQPRAEPNLRGFFFMDSADVDAAHARACEDPATRTGIFSMESMPFVSKDDLRSLPTLERGFRMQRGTDQIVARPYVIVTVETSAAALAVLDQMDEAVLFQGQVTGGSFEGQTVAALNFMTVSDAQDAMSSVTKVADQFTYHPWVSSTSVAEIND